MASHITTVTEANFEQEVLKSDKMVLIDFFSETCGPCKALAPTLEAFAEEHKDTVKVVKINAEENQNLSAAFQIQNVPTLITMKDGQGLYGAIGALPKSALEEMVAESFKLINNPPPKNKPDDNAPKHV